MTSKGCRVCSVDLSNTYLLRLPCLPFVCRYLLHLDGQACSSRLEQLLPLGSLVFKEDSGYWAFYHHLLQPHKHYMPFWKKGYVGGSWGRSERGRRTGGGPGHAC